jgi:hypothetical protein
MFYERGLRRLGESARQKRLEPVLVWPDGRLIDGFRRLRVARVVGRPLLYAIVAKWQFSVSEIRLIQLTKDLQRFDAAVKMAKAICGRFTYLYRNYWRPRFRSFGVARWASNENLNSWALLWVRDFILGYSASGHPCRMRRSCHMVMECATGSGKGVGIVIPSLLRYTYGSVACFDPKGGLCEVDNPRLVDSAGVFTRAPRGLELDLHWNDKAVQVITAVLAFVLMRVRNEALFGCAFGGGLPPVPLFAWSVTRSWRNVAIIVKSLDKSTSDFREQTKLGTTLFLQIPPEQLATQRGLLRSWASTLVRRIGSARSKYEELLLADEANVLGSFSSLEESLVCNRSCEGRMLAYQSESQGHAALKNTVRTGFCSMLAATIRRSESARFTEGCPCFHIAA